MNLLKRLLWIILALVMVIFDVSFLTNFSLNGASILFSFLILMIFSLLDKKGEYVIFALALVIGFSVFSSVPILVIAINFLILPIVVNYVRLNYFPVPTALTIFLYLLLATFLFDFSLLVYAGEWSRAGFTTVAEFVAMNTILGGIMYSLYLRFSKRFSIMDIKI